MKDTEIRKYAELMKELGLTGLEITEENSKVRLERTVTEKETVGILPVSQVTENPGVRQERDYISIKSPMVGVFYAAKAENADPYVKVGDMIQKGQTVGLVEAMKLMNEISAEEDGEILEICVTNGQVVEYGTDLFRIRR